MTNRLRRGDEDTARYRLRKALAELERDFAFYGLSLSSSVVEFPEVRRKAGFRLYEGLSRIIRCPRCRAGSRIYYRFTERKPWDKLSEFQCGFCGHEWQEVDNTYD